MSTDSAQPFSFSLKPNNGLMSNGLERAIVLGKQ